MTLKIDFSGSASLRWTVAFVIYLLTTFGNIYAQTLLECDPSNLPEYDLFCDGDTRVQILVDAYVPGNPSNPLGTCPSCDDGSGCTRAYFEIRLRLGFRKLLLGEDLIKAHNKWNCGDFLLKYKKIQLTMGTVVEPGGFTSLNKASTESCTNKLYEPLVNFLNYYFVANENTDEASLLINKPENVDNDYPVIEFHNYESDVLFVMAVDIVDGELSNGMGVYAIDFEYENTVGSGCSSISGLTRGYIPDPYQVSNTVSDDLKIGLNEPTCNACTTSFPLYLNAINNVPQVGSMDFTFDLLTGSGMPSQPPVLSFAGSPLPAPSVSTTLLPNNAGYSYHLTYSNLTNIPAGQHYLGNVTLGPDNCSAGYDYMATIYQGRADCEIVQVDQNAEQKKCSLAGVGECSEFQLLFTPFLNGGTCEHSDIAIYLQDIIAQNGTTTNFSLIDLDFDFDLDPGVSITSAEFYDGNGIVPGVITITGNQVSFYASGSVNWTSNHYIKVVFANAFGCVQGVSLSTALINPGNCSPRLNIPTDFFPLCKGPIHGNIQTEGGCYVSDVTVNFTPASGVCPGVSLTTLTGCGEYASSCLCTDIPKWIVKPVKTDDLYEVGPLSADDLLAIVLNNNNIVNFNSPYDYIAADAENDQDVDENDVFALQQLMLGNYNAGNNPWPSGFAPSWRFVDKATPPAPYPFPGVIKDFIQTPSPANGVDFVAVKLGSLFHDNGIRPAALCADGACNPVQKSAQTHSFVVSNGEVEKSVDGILRIPVLAKSEAPLSAWQMGLRFDPTEFDFVSIENGGLLNMSMSNFGLTNVNEGEIKVVWLEDMSTPNSSVHQGDVLFYLNLKPLGKVTDAGSIVTMDEEILENTGWTMDYTKYDFIQKTNSTIRNSDELAVKTDVRCRPNPSTSGFTLDIFAPLDASVQVIVFDMLGRRVFEKNTAMPAAVQSIAIPESAQWPAGIYRYEVSGSGIESRSGQMIKQ